MSQFNGYDLRVYDELGRMIGMASESKDLLPQMVKSKILTVFKGFNGVAKNLILFNERTPLPISPPLVDIRKNLTLKSERCLAYLIFEPEHMQIDAFGKQTVINYCKPALFKFLNATIV
jgi:hypothetical protein